MYLLSIFQFRGMEPLIYKIQASSIQTIVIKQSFVTKNVNVGTFIIYTLSQIVLYCHI